MKFVEINEDAIMYIISFLSFKDLVCMCLVSKQICFLSKNILEEKYKTLVLIPYRREKMIFWSNYLFFNNSFLLQCELYKNFYKKTRKKYNLFYKREQNKLRIL